MCGRNARGRRPTICRVRGMGRSRVPVVAALAVLAGLIGLVPAGAAHAAPSSPAATTVVHPRQRITVTAANYDGTTYATFRAYQLSGSSNTNWVEVFGPWTARVGYHGVAKAGQKREGDGRT